MRKSFFILVFALLAAFCGQAQQSAKVNLKKLGNTLRSMNLQPTGDWGCMQNELLIVCDTNKSTSRHVGLVDLDGRIVLPAQYNWVSFMGNSGLVRASIYDSVSDALLEGLLLRVGPAEWAWAVPPILEPEYLDEYEELGRAYSFPLVVDGYVDTDDLENSEMRMGLIDSLGNWLMPMEFEDLFLIDASHHLVETSEGIYNYQQQRYLLSNVRYMGDDAGLMRVYDKCTESVGLADMEGRWVVKPQYGQIFDPKDGLMLTRTEDASGKFHYAFLDMLGRVALQPDYDKVYPFSCRRALVSKGGKEGFIDLAGRLVIPLRYSRVYPFNENGWTTAELDNDGENKTTVVLDTAGNELMRTQWKCVGESGSTIVWTESNGDSDADLYFVTDLHGNRLCSYDDIVFDDCECDSPSDIVAVRQGKYWGLVDRSYRPLLPCKYSDVVLYGWGEGALVTLADGTNRYIDRRGRTLLAFDGLYAAIPIPNSGGLYSVQIYTAEKTPGGYNRMKWGLADSHGRTTFTRKEMKTSKQVIRSKFCAAHKAKKEKPAARPAAAIGSGAPSGNTVSDTADEVFVWVETDPAFPGGLDSLAAFLAANIEYPQLAKDNNISGTVYVSFVIERNGQVGNIRLLRDIGAGCGQEVVRVIKLMPNWEPGKQRGKPVRVQFNLPVKFELPEEAEEAGN